MSAKLSKGKYSGSSIDEVFQRDYSYLQWLSHERPPWAKQALEEIDLMKIDPHDYQMRFGKYESLLVSSIKKIDRKYFEWMKKMEYKDSRLMEAIKYFS